MGVRSVQVREFKARLSHYLALARSGQPLEIRSRNKLIARINGVPEEVPDGLARMIADGRARGNDGTKPQFRPVKLPQSGPLLSDIVLEQRGPRD
ncbi:MAG: type II toxin-antitoxin system prevent-host-death family antitoxin [Nitrococcus sp.]|nr:type II toxin-antitoxin system prevent-host-death family antitoxin [Nitrococcus sp.]